MFMLLGPLHSSYMPKVIKATMRANMTVYFLWYLLEEAEQEENEGKLGSWVHVSSAARKAERDVTPESCS